MSSESFFLVFETTDHFEVEELWQIFCEKDKVKQYEKANESLIEDNRNDMNDENFHSFVEDFTMYNASLISFDNYQFLFVHAPTNCIDEQ
jgi:hypothetical protein